MSFRAIAPLLCGGLLLIAAATSALAADPIPGVDVMLGKNPGGQLVATSQTNNEGVATFADVAPGSYRVSVTAGTNKNIRSTVRVGGKTLKIAISKTGNAATTFTLKTAAPVQILVEDNSKSRPDKFSIKANPK